MNSLNRGPQGGGGVRRGGPPPPGRPGGPNPPPGGGGSSGEGGPSGRGGDRPERKVADLWPDYLKDGYFDPPGDAPPAAGEPADREARGNSLRLEYVSRERVEPLVRAMAFDYPALTSGQLRRFFQHCRAIETRLRSGDGAWARQRAQFTFLDAAAADAYGKSPRKIPSLFYDFIRRNVAAVRSERDFMAGFLPHFEALVGFGSLHLKRERN